MKFLFNVFIFIALVFAGFVLASPYYFFPRPNSTSPQVAKVETAGDMEQYAHQAEMPFAEDIKPGLQKTVVWYDPSTRQKTDIAVVYLHGWSSSLKDTAPLMSLLANRLHANVFLTRFTAHGMKRPDGFETLTQQNLIDDAREAVAVGMKLGKHVLLVGMSTGATLAAEQAFERKDLAEPSAYVLMSPNFMPLKKQARYVTGPFGRLLARALVGPTYKFQALSPQHEEYWTTSYPSDGLVPMMDVVNYTNSLNLRQVTKPALFLFTHTDQLVSLSAMRNKFNEWGGSSGDTIKSLVDLDGATQHELVGDLFGPGATINASDAITDFAKNVIPKN